MFVLLDAGPLGQVTNPQASPETEAVKQWLRALLNAGKNVVLP